MTKWLLVVLTMFASTVLAQQAQAPAVSSFSEVLHAKDVRTLRVTFTNPIPKPGAGVNLYYTLDGNRQPKQADFSNQFTFNAGEPARVNETTFDVTATIPERMAAGTYKLTRVEVGVSGFDRINQQQTVPPGAPVYQIEDSETEKVFDVPPVRNIQPEQPKQ